KKRLTSAHCLSFLLGRWLPIHHRRFCRARPAERDVALRLCQRVLRREDRLLRDEHGEEVREALTVQISTVVPLRDVEAAAPGQVEPACFTGATKPVALGSVRVTTRGRAAFAGAARGDRRAVPAV